MNIHIQQVSKLCLLSKLMLIKFVTIFMIKRNKKFSLCIVRSLSLHGFSFSEKSYDRSLVTIAVTFERKKKKNGGRMYGQCIYWIIRYDARMQTFFSRVLTCTHPLLSYRIETRLLGMKLLRLFYYGIKIAGLMSNPPISARNGNIITVLAVSFLFTIEDLGKTDIA